MNDSACMDDVRHVARVLVINDHGEIYLLRGRDISMPERAPFWFTPGGKIDPGETPSEAASRELLEETGLIASPAQLGDIVGTELSDYSFDGQNYRQSGVFYAFSSNHAGLNLAGWSDIEARTIDHGTWWSVSDLRSTRETIYPTHLADMLAAWLARQEG